MLVTDEKGLTKRLDELNHNIDRICKTITISSDKICRALLCVAASGEYDAVKNSEVPSDSLLHLIEFFAAGDWNVYDEYKEDNNND